MILAVVLAAAPQLSVRASSGLPQYIDEYDVPTPSSAPLAVTVDRNGIVWFTESNATKLGRFDPSNDSFREYTVPGAGDMWGMTIDQQGYIWLTQYSLKASVRVGGAVEPGGYGRLIRFNPNNGNFTVINISTPGAFPFRVTTDSEGRIWFTELLGDQIGYYDPQSGKLQTYAVPTPFAGPADLTFDRHGLLWFTETYNQSVAKFNPSTGTFVEYRFSSLDPTQYVGSPVGIAVTPDGIVWVGDHGGNWIVEFNSTSLHVTLYPTHFPPPEVYPISLVNDLLIDGQGRIWFTEHGGNSIGYLDPFLEKMVEYPVPTGPISTVLWLAQAPNGNLWFTEWSADKIGVVHASLPIPLSLSVSENPLNLPVGGQMCLSLELNSSQGFVGSGTYECSWPSYNPGEVNVTFSPQDASLSGETNAQSQARITVSPHTLPGEYVLGLGFDAGTVRVWSMVQTEVTAQTPITEYIASNPWLPVGAIVIILLGVTMMMRRVRGRGRRKAGGALTMRPALATSRIIQAMFLISGVLGVVILVLDRDLRNGAPGHYDALILFVAVDFLVGTLTFQMSEKLMLKVAAIWSTLRIVIQIGDIALAPIFFFTYVEFADYLFNPASMVPATLVNPPGIPSIPIDLILICDVVVLLTVARASIKK